MRRIARGRAGFTLLELIVAMVMAAVVIAGMNSLLLPVVLMHVKSTRGQTVQLGLAGAQSAAERGLRRSTMVLSPAIAGLPADALEACVNAVPNPGSAPAALDPAQPVAWFAMCAADGLIHYHEGAGCPPDYRCGVRPAMSFGGGGAASSARTSFFRRTLASTAVDLDLSLSSGESSGTVHGAAAFTGAAGGNQ